MNIYIYIYIVIIVISLIIQNARKKYKEKIIRIKGKKKKIVHDDAEENVNEKIYLQDDKHDENIDLEGVDQAR